MPCYTQRTVSVDLKAADPDALLAALEAAGLRSHTTAPLADIVAKIIETGRLTLTGSSMSPARAAEIAGNVSRHYAAEAIKRSARKYGWQVSTDAKDAQHLTLGKRGAF